MRSNENVLGYVLLIFIILIGIKCYYDNDFFQLKCIVSDVNGKKYCVRERNKLQEASDLLASTTEKMKQLVNHLHETQPTKPEVQLLVKNFNPRKIKEILPTSEYATTNIGLARKFIFISG